jgi:MFS family permease
METWRGPGGLPLKAEEFARQGALLYVAILAGPCVAGLLLTGLVDGSPGLREVLTRLRRWRVGARWYIVALLPGLAMTATTLLLSLVSSGFRPAVLDSSDKGAPLFDHQEAETRHIRTQPGVCRGAVASGVPCLLLGCS